VQYSTVPYSTVQYSAVLSPNFPWLTDIKLLLVFRSGCALHSDWQISKRRFMNRITTETSVTLRRAVPFDSELMSASYFKGSSSIPGRSTWHMKSLYSHGDRFHSECCSCTWQYLTVPVQQCSTLVTLSVTDDTKSKIFTVSLNNTLISKTRRKEQVKPIN